MQAWSRLLSGLLLALAPAALVAAPELSLTGVTIRPAEAKPGDQITLSVGVTNSGASGISPVTGLPIAVAADTWPAGSTATLGVTFTHVATGYTFSFTGTGTLSAGLAGGGTAGTVDLNALVPVSFTEAGPYRVALVWVSHTGAAPGDWKGRSFATSTPAFSVIGKPDFQIVSLTYAANPALTGGAVVPMTLKYLNATTSNGVNNVPFVPVPGLTQFRIQVVLSSNPVFGDADDFQLTTFDRATKLDADLIVLTTKGCSGLRRMLLGGTAAGLGLQLAAAFLVEGRTGIGRVHRIGDGAHRRPLRLVGRGPEAVIAAQVARHGGREA